MNAKTKRLRYIFGMMLVLTICAPALIAQPKQIQLQKRSVVQQRPASQQQPNTSQKKVKHSYRNVLARYGIRSKTDEELRKGIQGFFDRINPSKEQQKAALQFVADVCKRLQDDSFHIREKASNELISNQLVTLSMLDPYLQSSDPEVAYRIEMAIKKVEVANRNEKKIFYAILKTIEFESIPGFTQQILMSLDELRANDRYMIKTANAALTNTATKKDIELLRQLLDNEKQPCIQGIITAYGKVVGKDSIPRLRKLLESNNENIVLATATSLAEYRETSILKPLIKLMDSKEMGIRYESVRLLRRVTGNRFGFLASEDRENRLKKIEKWKSWVSVDSNRMKIVTPVVETDETVGHVLVLLYQKHAAVEFDSSGKEIWRQEGLNYPWAIKQLPNGNRLVGSYRGKYLVEYNAAGDEVWRKNDMPGGVFGVQRLENGNTIAGCHSSKTVVEVAPDGEIVWKAVLDGEPMGVQRLENGNTMAALFSSGRVVEINPEGEVVWQLKNLKSPRTVQRLENGNTLVSCANGSRAVEFSPDKEVVWEVDGLETPYDAQRLKNGNTLITDKFGLRIYSPEKEVIWKKKVDGVGRAFAF